VFIEERPEHAGDAIHTVFVDDIDDLTERVARRSLDGVKRDTYPNGGRRPLPEIPMRTRSVTAVRGSKMGLGS
jgi:hypothetical protein